MSKVKVILKDVQYLLLCGFIPAAIIAGVYFICVFITDGFPISDYDLDQIRIAFWSMLFLGSFFGGWSLVIRYTFGNSDDDYHPPGFSH